MRIDPLNIEIANDELRTVDSGTSAAPVLGVACLISFLPFESALGVAAVDNAESRLARALDTILSKGVQLVCLENDEGDSANVAAMGQAVGQALLRHRPQVVGVDDTDVVAEMRSIAQLVEGLRDQHADLFARFDVLLGKAARSASPHVADFIQIRLGYDRGKLDICSTCARLLALRDRRGLYCPRTLLRYLAAISAAGDENVELAKKQQEELLKRVRACANHEVVDAHMKTTLVGSLPAAWASHQSIRARLSPEQRAIALFCNQAANDILVAFAGDFHQLTMYQSIHKHDRFRGPFDMARLVGIDVIPYEQFLRNIWHQRNLPHSSGELMRRLPQIMQNVMSSFVLGLRGTSTDNSLLVGMESLLVLGKLATLQLTAEDFDRLLDTIDTCHATALAGILDKLGGGPLDPNFLTACQGLDERRDRLIAYYTLANGRAKSMALRTIAAARRFGCDRAVLICNGFHLPRLISTFKDESVSYSILYPIHD